MVSVILMIVGLVVGLISEWYRYRLRNDDWKFHRDALHQECQ